MTKASQDLLTKALALSESERAELAKEIIASLDGLPDPEAEEAWAAELERRPELDLGRRLVRERGRRRRRSRRRRRRRCERNVRPLGAPGY